MQSHPKILMWGLSQPTGAMTVNQRKIFEDTNGEINAKIDATNTFVSSLLDVNGNLKPLSKIPLKVRENASKDIFRNFLPAARDGTGLSEEEYTNLRKSEGEISDDERLRLFLQYWHGKGFNDRQFAIFIALTIQNVTGHIGPIRHSFSTPVDFLKTEQMNKPRARNYLEGKDEGIIWGFDDRLRMPSLTFKIAFVERDIENSSTEKKLSEGEFEILFSSDGQVVIQNNMHFIPDALLPEVEKALKDCFFYDPQNNQYTMPLSAETYSKLLQYGYIVYSGPRQLTNDRNAQVPNEEFYSFVERFRSGPSELDLSLIRQFPQEWLQVKGDTNACRISLGEVFNARILQIHSSTKELQLETTGHLWWKKTKPNAEMRALFSGDTKTVDQKATKYLGDLYDAYVMSQYLPKGNVQQEKEKIAIRKDLVNASQQIRQYKLQNHLGNFQKFNRWYNPGILYFKNKGQKPARDAAAVEYGREAVNQLKGQMKAYLAAVKAGFSEPARDETSLSDLNASKQQLKDLSSRVQKDTTGFFGRDNDLMHAIHDEDPILENELKLLLQEVNVLVTADEKELRSYLPLIKTGVNEDEQRAMKESEQMHRLFGRQASVLKATTSESKKAVEEARTAIEKQEEVAKAAPASAKVYGKLPVDEETAIPPEVTAQEESKEEKTTVDEQKGKQSSQLTKV